MCGFVSRVGREDAVPVLLAGPANLECRGCDSAGPVAGNGSGSVVDECAGVVSALVEAFAADARLRVPDAHRAPAGLPATVRLQLPSYRAATRRGRPVDEPRPLAKSVTAG